MDFEKGEILEKGVGVDLEKGCVNPLTNYDYCELKQICTRICTRESTRERVHLLVKLLAISLQACKFTKNELLHTSLTK